METSTTTAAGGEPAFRLANCIAADQLGHIHGKGRALGAAYDEATPQVRGTIIRALVERINLQPGKLIMTIRPKGLLRELGFEVGSGPSESQASSR